jgi:hypothetical protein
MGEKKISYVIIFERTKRKRPILGSGNRWDKTTKMQFKAIEYEGVNYILCETGQWKASGRPF